MAPNEFDFFSKILEKIGFPIFVAGWFMLRSDKRQDEILKIQSQIMALLKKGTNND